MMKNDLFFLLYQSSYITKEWPSKKSQRHFCVVVDSAAFCDLLSAAVSRNLLNYQQGSVILGIRKLSSLRQMSPDEQTIGRTPPAAIAG